MRDGCFFSNTAIFDGTHYWSHLGLEFSYASQVLGKSQIILIQFQDFGGLKAGLRLYKDQSISNSLFLLAFGYSGAQTKVVERVYQVLSHM